MPQTPVNGVAVIFLLAVPQVEDKAGAVIHGFVKEFKMFLIAQLGAALARRLRGSW
jgi:hypothetical protein